MVNILVAVAQALSTLNNNCTSLPSVGFWIGGWLFSGWAEPFKGVKTRMLLQEYDGGVVIDTVTVNNLPKIVGFPSSRYERTSSSNRAPYLEVKENLLQRLSSLGFTGLTFSATEYKNNSCPITYKCTNGHLVKNSVVGGLKTTGCRECSKSAKSWGLYKDFLEREDTLYLIEIRDDTNNEVFFKVGRTFHLPTRLATFKRSGLIVKVLTKVKGKHEDVFSIEQEIHKSNTQYSFLPANTFGGRYECYKGNLAELTKRVKICSQ